MTTVADMMILGTTLGESSTSLNLKGTSSVHHREFTRVTAECGSDVRPAGSRRLLVRRREARQALWDDGTPEVV